MNAPKSPKSSQESENKLQAIRKRIIAKFADIFGGVPLELPPLREINHRIPLMDDGK